MPPFKKAEERTTARLDGEVSSIRKARVQRGLKPGGFKVSGLATGDNHGNVIVKTKGKLTIGRKEWPVDDDAVTRHPFEGYKVSSGVLRVHTGHVFSLEGANPAEVEVTGMATTDFSISGNGSVWLVMTGSFIETSTSVTTLPAGDLTLSTKRWEAGSSAYTTTDPGPQGSAWSGAGPKIYVKILDFSTLESDYVYYQNINSNLSITDVFPDITYV